MSDVNDQLAELLAADYRARLRAHSYFQYVNLIARYEDSVDDKVGLALGFLDGENVGKVGSCVVIEEPEYKDQFAGMQDGPQVMNWRFLALCHRLIATGENGTGLRALAIAKQIRRTLRNYHAGGLAHLLAFDRIVRDEGTFKIPTKDGKGRLVDLEVWAVEAHCIEGDFVPYKKCAPIQLTPASGAAPQTVTVSGGESGGSLFYSLDNTYPSLAYSAPVAVASAATFRALSRKTGFADSDVIAANFT